MTDGNDKHAMNVTSAIPVIPITGSAVAASPSPLRPTVAATPPKTASRKSAASNPNDPMTMLRMPSTFAWVSTTWPS